MLPVQGAYQPGPGSKTLFYTETELQEVLTDVLEGPELGRCLTLSLLRGDAPTAQMPGAPSTWPPRALASPLCPLPATLSEAGLGAQPEDRNSQPWLPDFRGSPRPSTRPELMS